MRTGGTWTRPARIWGSREVTRGGEFVRSLFRAGGFESLIEFARLECFSDDVAASHELTADVELGDRRPPAGEMETLKTEASTGSNRSGGLARRIV